MITTEYLSLVTFLREKINNVADTKKATSLALGVAVSKLIPLPTSTMQDISYQFDTIVVHRVNQYLAEFNENVVVDVDLARETARSFWLIRYSMANPDLDMLIIPKGPNTFVEKLSNVTLFANPKSIEFLNQYSEAMVAIVNRIQMLIKGFETSDLS